MGYNISKVNVNKLIRKFKPTSNNVLYSMKTKEQTRKLASGCSKHCFEVVDRTDEVSNHTHGKATLTWFEEIFKEY
ncbi:N-ethylammeline chlorohydrolase [Streptococcus pneumoniae SPNA45]|nr:N-ethylammeline chlorohydrolase [Streptococcus pneumoniae SPNA45]